MKSESDNSSSNGNSSDEIDKIRQARREKAEKQAKMNTNSNNGNNSSNSSNMASTWSIWEWCSIVVLLLRLGVTFILLIIVSTSIFGRGDDMTDMTPTPIEILGIKQYCVCLFSLYAYIVLIQNFIILWLFSNGNSNFSSNVSVSKFISIIPYKVTSHEIQLLCMYIIALMLLLPNALNNAELLIIRNPTQSIQSIPGVLGSGSGISVEHFSVSGIVTLFQYCIGLLLDNNRIYKSIYYTQLLLVVVVLL